MRRDKYDDGAEEHQRGLSTTTKMAAAAVGGSIDSAIEKVLIKQMDCFH